MFNFSECFTVEFEDGVNYKATRARIRSSSSEITIDDVVEARFSDARWYTARVIQLPGKYNN